jgi:hypothetical protein
MTAGLAEQFHPDHLLHLSSQEQLYDVPAIFILIQASIHVADHRPQLATLLSQQGITPTDPGSRAYYHERIKSKVME